MRLFFAPFDEKHNLFERFEKILENFPKKIAKNALFLHIFQKIFNKPFVTFFTPLDENRKLLGNFKKIVKILMKILLKN